MTSEDGDDVREEVTARVNELVKERGDRQRLLEKSGLAASTLDRILRGANVATLPNLVKIARAAGVSLDWLAGIEKTAAMIGPVPGAPSPEVLKLARAMGRVQGPPPQPQQYRAGSRHEPKQGEPAPEQQPQPSEGFVTVPMLQLRASAGPGMVAGQPVTHREGVVSFREDWLRSLGLIPGRADAMTAVGDSMEPTIRDGDLLLVDRSIDRVVNHGIYVLVFNGAVLVKRIQARLDGSLVLMSDNERYQNETVAANEANELIIEGRVRWFGRMI